MHFVNKTLVHISMLDHFPITQHGSVEPIASSATPARVEPPDVARSSIEGSVSVANGNKPLWRLMGRERVATRSGARLYTSWLPLEGKKRERKKIKAPQE